MINGPITITCCPKRIRQVRHAGTLMAFNKKQSLQNFENCSMNFAFFENRWYA